MSIHAIAANNELIVNTDTIITSALGFSVQATLPKINDGTAGSVAVGTAIRVVSTSPAGNVQLVTKDKCRLIGSVYGRNQAVIVARAGTVQGEQDSWNWLDLPNVPAAFVLGSAAYVQAEYQALRAAVVNAGLMKAE